MSAPSVHMDVHTPNSSFVILHSLTQESLQSLFDKLTRKVHHSYHGERVGPGWLKYEFNDSIWDLEDESDYTIFVWRQRPSTSPVEHDPAELSSGVSSTSVTTAAVPRSPTLYLHDPNQPLPVPPEYQNASYYIFHPSRQVNHSSAHPHKPTKSNNASTIRKGKKKGDKNVKGDERLEEETSFKQKFNKFHSENGVRTVMGSIGPVQNVRMLLKAGYRHVYISRKFALENGFIPADTAPGHYGYTGLVHLGTWPITLTPSTVPSQLPDAPPASVASHSDSTTTKSKHKGDSKGPKPTMMTVYLSEEPHFDVVLGRSFFERRQIRLTSVDPTDVICLDTGEKIECELVILKDGRGEIVTVT
ncbi:hypothetical protein BDP27DRAFT_1234384 [Rhodocollybia butyracea]|uniref:Uncharacterized protein n=1 Tax=Rhodocollybia butyracea TaxID=206335 RepID=A0A9P5PAF7_9AGAR|nr:hypothetical protein BDP27DRAFT_1234384 [Rhodocollybia butyracea]